MKESEKIDIAVDGAIDIMLDCFGGVDGGQMFVRLKRYMGTLIDKIENDAPDKEASIEITKIVVSMGKLIELMGKQ